MLRLGVLISGRGSNLQSLIADSQTPDAVTEIGCVISNVAEAPGLAHAEDAQIPSTTLSHKGFASRQDYDARLARILHEHNVDLVCLAGFMRILDQAFVTDWYGKLINIHPSLLPAFKGLNVHQRVIESGVRLSGCTVHFVSPEMDEGPTIGQAAVPVLPEDTEETLGARVLACEHVLYPRVVRAIANGHISLKDNVVRYNTSEIASTLTLHAGLSAATV